MNHDRNCNLTQRIKSKILNQLESKITEANDVMFSTKFSIDSIESHSSHSVTVPDYKTIRLIIDS